jgi:hypothetical protein
MIKHIDFLTVKEKVQNNKIKGTKLTSTLSYISL